MPGLDASWFFRGPNVRDFFSRLQDINVPGVRPAIATSAGRATARADLPGRVQLAMGANGVATVGGRLDVAIRLKQAQQTAVSSTTATVTLAQPLAVGDAVIVVHQASGALNPSTLTCPGTTLAASAASQHIWVGQVTTAQPANSVVTGTWSTTQAINLTVLVFANVDITNSPGGWIDASGLTVTAATSHPNNDIFGNGPEPLYPGDVVIAGASWAASGVTVSSTTGSGWTNVGAGTLGSTATWHSIVGYQIVAAKNTNPGVTWNLSGSAIPGSYALVLRGAATLPLAPTGLRPYHTFNGADIYWEPVADATSYKVYDGNTLLSTNSGRDDHHLLSSGLVPGAIKNYSVSAVNAAGEGPRCPVQQFVVASTPSWALRNKYPATNPPTVASTTQVITATSSPGESYVVGVIIPSATTTVTSVVGAGATWVQAGRKTNGAMSVELWYALNVPGGSDTITVTVSASSLFNIDAIQIDHVDKLGNAFTASGAGNAWSMPVSGTDRDGGFFVGILGQADANAGNQTTNQNMTFQDNQMLNTSAATASARMWYMGGLGEGTDPRIAGAVSGYQQGGASATWAAAYLTLDRAAVPLGTASSAGTSTASGSLGVTHTTKLAAKLNQATLFGDNFNRANGAPGTPWSVLGTGTVSIVGNQLAVADPAFLWVPGSGDRTVAATVVSTTPHPDNGGWSAITLGALSGYNGNATGYCMRLDALAGQYSVSRNGGTGFAGSIVSGSANGSYANPLGTHDLSLGFVTNPDASITVTATIDGVAVLVFTESNSSNVFTNDGVEVYDGYSGTLPGVSAVFDNFQVLVPSAGPHATVAATLGLAGTNWPVTGTSAGHATVAAPIKVQRALAASAAGHATVTQALAVSWGLSAGKTLPTLDAVSTAKLDGVSGNGVSWSHTCASGAKALVVGVGTNGSDLGTTKPASVTYGGVPLTFVGGRTPGTIGGESIWVLKNPPAGTATIAVTMTTTQGYFIMCVASSFFTAAGTMGASANAFLPNFNNQAAITPASSTGDLIIGAAYYRSGYTLVSGETDLGHILSASSPGEEMFSKPGGAGVSVSMAASSNGEFVAAALLGQYAVSGAAGASAALGRTLHAAGASAGVATTTATAGLKRAVVASAVGHAAVTGAAAPTRGLFVTVGGVATSTATATSGGPRALASVVGGTAVASAATLVTHGLIGSSTGVGAVAGTAQVQRFIIGAANGHGAVVSTVAIRRGLASSVAGVAVAQGVAGVRRELAGVAGGRAVVVSASAVAHPLTSAVHATAAVGGLVVVGHVLAASAAGVATAGASSLLVQHRLLGVVAGGADVTSSLVITRGLVGSTHGVGGVVGGLTGVFVLTAHVAGTSVVVGAVLIQRALRAAVVGVGTVVGVLAVLHRLQAASSAGASAVGVVLITRTVVGAAHGVAGAAGTARLAAALEATTGGAGVGAASLQIQRAMQASASGSGAAFATLALLRRLQGVAAGTATTAGTMAATRTFVAATHGASVAIGAIVVVHPLTSSAAGLAAMSAALSLAGALAAGASGLAASAGTVSVTRGLVATSVGAATSVGTAGLKRPLAAVSTGLATASATVVFQRPLQASAAGLASVAGLVRPLKALVGAAAGVASAAAATRLVLKLASQAHGAATTSVLPRLALALAAGIHAGATAGAGVRVARGLQAASAGRASAAAPARIYRGLMAAVASAGTAVATLASFRFPVQLAARVDGHGAGAAQLDRIAGVRAGCVGIAVVHGAVGQSRPVAGRSSGVGAALAAVLHVRRTLESDAASASVVSGVLQTRRGLASSCQGIAAVVGQSNLQMALQAQVVGLAADRADLVAGYGLVATAAGVATAMALRIGRATTRPITLRLAAYKSRTLRLR